MMKFITTKTTIIASVMSLALSACGDTTSDKQSQVTPVAETTTSATSEQTPLPHYLTRDIQDEVFYFVLPDRFNNGNPDNDNGSQTIAISQGGFDKTKKGHYHGGDIQGLTDKIPYLKEMGITSIWLTPILRNQAVQGDITGYHGYWVLDFTEIDPHLGSNADLKHFIDTAHKHNVKVFFDIITNHTADVIKFEECHKAKGVLFSDGKQLCDYKTLAQVASGDKYTPYLPQGSENVKVPAWLNDPKFYHNQGDSTFEGENSVYGDFFGLDDINTDDQAVVDGMIDIFKDIISQFKPDGFRIDTVKHVNIEFWQQFAPALVKHANEQGLPKFFMFGEVFDGNPDVLSKFTTEGNMQSVLDFGFAFAVKDVLVDQKGTSQLTHLFAQDSKYNDADSNANQLLSFVGNHDAGRLAWMLSKSEFNYGHDEILARLKLAHSMMYFLRGIPVVYYGSEQGFVGDGGNHDARQDMMPSLVPSYNDDVLIGTDKTTADDNFDTKHPIYQALAEYAAVYQANRALRYGQQNVVYSSEEASIFAVTRTLASGEELLVMFNTSNEIQQVTFDFNKTIDSAIYDNGQTLTSHENNQLMVAMSPLSVSIYQVK